MTQRPTHGSGRPDLSAAGWRTSSHSPSRSECVETAFLTDRQRRRAPQQGSGRLGPVLCLSREWDAFVKGAKDGEFDLP
jgi:hypothetical protein